MRYVISYFGDTSDLGRRVVIWPAEHFSSMDFIARAGISSFVGFKALLFNAEQDLQLVPLSPKITEIFSDFDPLDFLRFYTAASEAESRTRDDTGSSVCAG
jgi:hypothetical protein